MRGCELADLQFPRDVDLATGILRLHETKNGRPHEVFLHPWARPLLWSWLEHRGRSPGPLLRPLTGELRSLSAERVRASLQVLLPEPDGERTFVVSSTVANALYGTRSDLVVPHGLFLMRVGA
jgi:integrase